VDPAHEIVIVFSTSVVGFGYGKTKTWAHDSLTLLPDGAYFADSAR